MYTIARNMSDTKEINKSKFIGYLIKINSTDDVKNILDKMKDEYKDATHICYAYICDGKEKAFDDGEPSGTAGIPILDILRKNELDHILAIVVRYFGGIKLGAGGLLRAYANSINDLVKSSEIKELVDGYKIRFEIPYDKISYVDQKVINILYKEFDLNVIYEAIVDETLLEDIKNIAIKLEILDKMKTSF